MERYGKQPCFPHTGSWQRPCAYLHGPNSVFQSSYGAQYIRHLTLLIARPFVQLLENDLWSADTFVCFPISVIIISVMNAHSKINPIHSQTFQFCRQQLFASSLIFLTCHWQSPLAWVLQELAAAAASCSRSPSTDVADPGRLPSKYVSICKHMKLMLPVTPHSYHTNQALICWCLFSCHFLKQLHLVWNLLDFLLNKARKLGENEKEFASLNDSRPRVRTCFCVSSNPSNFCPFLIFSASIGLFGCCWNQVSNMTLSKFRSEHLLITLLVGWVARSQMS